MRQALDEIVALNEVWRESADHLEGLRIGLTVYIDPFWIGVYSNEFKKRQIDVFKEISSFFHEHFQISFEPYFLPWDYGKAFELGTSFKKNTGIFLEDRNSGNLKRRFIELKLLHFFEYDPPTIFSGVFGYCDPLSGGKRVGYTNIGWPFMVVCGLGDKFIPTFQHELCHCLGADHSNVPSLMYPKECGNNTLDTATKETIKKRLESYPYLFF